MWTPPTNAEFRLEEIKVKLMYIKNITSELSPSYEVLIAMQIQILAPDSTRVRRVNGALSDFTSVNKCDTGAIVR